MDFAERVKRKNEFDASLIYGTKKFNLITGRDKHQDYRKKSDDNWLNSKTGFIHEKFAEKRNCPLCENNNYQILFIKSGFPHVRCNNCELVYVNPILSEEEYKKLWSVEDSWEAILENPEQIKMQALEADYSLDVMELYLKKDKKNKENINICDVGCGPGTLLTQAKQRGYSVFGIEPNRRCHQFLKQKDIAYTGDFFPLKTDLNEKFDCIFLLNTLEHLRDPLQTINEAKKLLKKSGLIYISVPTINSLVSRILHEKAGVFGGHSHIQFFNQKTLSLILEKSGFKVLEFETIITEIGVIKNYLSFNDPYFGDCQEKVNFITPEFIYQNHMARNINIIGQIIN